MKNATGETGFYERYRQILGKDFFVFKEYQNKSLPKTIRVNTLKNPIPEFLEWAKKTHPDWILSPHCFGEGIFCIDRKDRRIPLGKTLGHIQGRFYMQEASSFLPVLALDIRPQQKALDIAAAPGSKTTQMAALMQGKGLLVANEFSSSRAKTLVFNLQKSGVSNAALTHFSGEKFGKFLPNFFDRILLDAPCTGEGTARKDPEALKNWSEKRIGSSAKLQKNLILSAFEALSFGGILTYSTCTLAPEENEEVVTFLLRSFPDSAEVIDLSSLFPKAKKAPGISAWNGKDFPHAKKMLRIWPHLFNSEGFFVASVRKKSAQLEESGELFQKKKRFVLRKKIHPQNSGSLLRRKDEISQMVQNFLKNEFGFTLSENGNLFRKNDDIWFLPEYGDEILGSLRFDRPGICLGKIITDHRSEENIFRISHEFALAFGQYFSGNRVLEISQNETDFFLAGKNLSFQKDIPLGDVLLRFEGFPLGLAKNTGEILKNNLPRNFVMKERE